MYEGDIMTTTKNIGMELALLILIEAERLRSHPILEQSKHLDNLEALIKTARLILE